MKKINIGDVINMADRVVVYTTDNPGVLKHFPKVGTPVAMHPWQAQDWIAKGKATETAPETKSKTKA
jgi:hypothetical protein